MREYKLNSPDAYARLARPLLFRLNVKNKQSEEMVWIVTEWVPRGE